MGFLIHGLGMPKLGMGFLIHGFAQHGQHHVEHYLQHCLRYKQRGGGFAAPPLWICYKMLQIMLYMLLTMLLAMLLAMLCKTMY